MANEKRLIDANALSESIKSGSGTALQKFFADVCVATAPTVDAVEVVRCKDCEYSGHFDGLLYCENSRGLAGTVSPEGFCSYGERRNNEPEKPV